MDSNIGEHVGPEMRIRSPPAITRLPILHKRLISGLEDGLSPEFVLSPTERSAQGLVGHAIAGWACNCTYVS